MAEHYYSKTTDTPSDPKDFTFNFRGETFIFTTDNGVFSKGYIDYGSFAMLNAFKPNDIDLPILDMGSGYGPIGITVSRLYNKKTVMCEINERAYNLSLKNIERNKVDSIAYNSNLYEKVMGMKFSSIITNPPIRAGKETVFKIYEGAYSHLEKGGELWVVIQKKQGAPSSKTRLFELFGNCDIMSRDHGYYILKSVKND